MISIISVGKAVAIQAVFLPNRNSLAISVLIISNVFFKWALRILFE